MSEGRTMAYSTLILKDTANNKEYEHLFMITSQMRHLGWFQEKGGKEKGE